MSSDNAVLSGDEFCGCGSMLASFGQGGRLGLDVCCCGDDEDRGLEAGGLEGLYNHGRLQQEVKSVGLMGWFVRYSAIATNSSTHKPRPATGGVGLRS